MHLTDLHNKKIGILGFGLEGQAVAKFLEQNGLHFSVFDQENKQQQLDALKLHPEAVFWGSNYLSHFTKPLTKPPTNSSASSLIAASGGFNILFRSPGIKYFAPEIQQAKKNGALITSQIKFFIENCPAKIIGITGTKGKGSTAKLLYEIMQAGGMPVHLAGNFGVEALPLLAKVGPEDYVILELSSFQLQDLEISPHIAVVLMVVPEHLNYHADIEEYIQAKSSITKYQINTDIAVINYDYEYSMQIGKQGSAKKFYIQTLAEDKLDKADPFAIYQPQKYLKIKDGVFAEQLHGNISFVAGGDLQMLINAADVPLRGFHNIQNIAAAAAVARALEIKDQVIIEAIKNYKGLEHRLEFVAEIKGIKFYNDSIGTMPESALAAIKAFHEPVIAIIGGFDKHADYEAFAVELTKQKNLRGVVLLGQIAEKLQSALGKNKYSEKVLTGAKNMSEAFDQAISAAEKGNVVVLAPGTSSFGMFKNYQDRGAQFKDQVMKFSAKA